MFPAVKLIHDRRMESCGLLRLPKLYPLVAAIRKKTTIESTKVAAVNTRASQRAIDLGVASTASAPITGSRIIQVRSLVNITVLSSLHKADQHKDDRYQDRNATEESRHVGLDLAGLNVPQVASCCHDQPRHAVDQPVDNIRIEGLLDVRDAEHHVAD